MKEPLFELSLLPQAVSPRVGITGIPEECSRNTAFAVKLPESDFSAKYLCVPCPMSALAIMHSPSSVIIVGE
ncbi:hypothetical protein [Edaphobacter aggregans]|uniref:hypothetical protein n=1 Tax=Edaphobacter aggregans TaxID=570835 RepID=UPI000557FA0D|nr:hypothetical protein [Edaphobacter aggregans]